MSDLDMMYYLRLLPFLRSTDVGALTFRISGCTQYGTKINMSIENAPGLRPDMIFALFFRGHYFGNEQTDV